jgi:hypothetical protein
MAFVDWVGREGNAKMQRTANWLSASNFSAEEEVTWHVWGGGRGGGGEEEEKETGRFAYSIL